MSKLNIGIFGDSFGIDKKNETLSWVELLAEKYNVTNFCQSGSCLYFSLKLFLENKDSFDHIIFIETIPGRLLLPNKELPWANVSSYGNAMWLYEQYKCIEYKLSADYFVHIANDNYDNFVHGLMMDKFNEVKTDSMLHLNSNSMMLTVTFKETENIIPGMDLSLLKNDKRNCHMTPKNNQIFYECVDNWIQTKQFNLKKCKFDFTKEYVQQYVGNLDE
jgi:hypothetical protein